MKYINYYNIKCINIIIILFILYIFLLYTQNKIEKFKVMNETIIKKDFYDKNMNNNKIYNITSKDLLNTVYKIKDNKFLSSNDLFNILIILIINKYPTQNIKHVLYYFFGPYVINERIDYNIKVEYPIDIINRIRWDFYIDYIIQNKLDISKIINFKENITIRRKFENSIPLLRHYKIVDKNTIDYANNYNKLLNNNKNDNQLYFDRLQNIIEVDNSYSLSNNKKYIQNLKKEKNMLPLPNLWNYNTIHSKNNKTLELPYRYQLPLDFNCQRVWQQCETKNNLNSGYNYYKYYNPEDKYNSNKLKSDKQD